MATSSACDDEGSGENNEESKESEDGARRSSKHSLTPGDGGRGSYSAPADWRVGRISSPLTARLPFVLEPERTCDNSEIYTFRVIKGMGKPNLYALRRHFQVPR